MGDVTRTVALIGMAGVLAAFAVPATAADLLRAEPLPPAPVGTSWSGFYVGGKLGTAFNPNNLSIKDLSEERDLTLKFSNETQLIGGVQAGYNWQMGSWLVGVEGDVDFADNIQLPRQRSGSAWLGFGQLAALRYWRRGLY